MSNKKTSQPEDHDRFNAKPSDIAPAGENMNFRSGDAAEATGTNEKKQNPEGIEWSQRQPQGQQSGSTASGDQNQKAQNSGSTSSSDEEKSKQQKMESIQKLSKSVAGDQAVSSKKDTPKL